MTDRQFAHSPSPLHFLWALSQMDTHLARQVNVRPDPCSMHQGPCMLAGIRLPAAPNQDKHTSAEGFSFFCLSVSDIDSTALLHAQEAETEMRRTCKEIFLHCISPPLLQSLLTCTFFNHPTHTRACTHADINPPPHTHANKAHTHTHTEILDTKVRIHLVSGPGALEG